MLIGYARTSTVDQVAGLDAQQHQLAATGCTKLFCEQASSVGQRDQLDAAIERRGALSGGRSYSDTLRSSVRNGLKGARGTGRYARIGGIGGFAVGLLAGTAGGIAAGEFAENFCGGAIE